jgi:hypothetical protein
MRIGSSVPPRLDAHDGVHTGVVTVVPVEDLAPKQILLDLLVLAAEPGFDGETKKPPQPLGVDEPLAGQNLVEMAAHHLGLVVGHFITLARRPWDLNGLPRV